jgi:predicted AAA+ superfamily ATPase
MNVDTVERLIADFQERPLPDTVQRDIRLPMIERKVDALIGMRRSGKTYTMFDAMRRLLDAGVSKQRMLYLNLEDDRLGEPTVSHLDAALEIFYRRDPSARTQRSFLFLDEIQMVPSWERFVRRVLDTEDVRVVVTGSSAKLLSTEVASSLRGRGIAVEVLPYNLREAARAEGLAIDTETWPPGARARSRIAALCVAYLTRGGFAEVQQVNDFDRVQVLQDYVELVVIKDVVQRHRVTNITALRHLVRALFASNANGFSLSKLHGTLRSQGLKIGKQTLLDYLDHLLDAYICFTVPIRSRSEKQRIVNPRKVYAVDPGLATAMATGGAVNSGALLENVVYLELRRRLGRAAAQAIAYYRTKGGFEVDFVVEAMGPWREPQLIQACSAIGDPETARREIRALDEAMHELGVLTATIVTLSDHYTTKTDTGEVHVVPLWHWALGPPADGAEQPG